MFILHVSLTLLLELAILSTCLLHPPATANIESAAKCLRTIANTYFFDRPTVTVFPINSSRDETVLKDLLRSTTHVKKIFEFDKYKVDFFDMRKKYAVLIGESLEEFISRRNQFEKLSLWNARARYVFYSFKNDERMIEEFRDAVWYFYIINAVVVMPSSNDDTILKIFSWFPYEGDLCGVDFDVKQLDTCQNGVFLTNTNLFPDKIPLDIHGCPVRFRVLIWPPFVLPPEDEIIEDDKVLNITAGIEVEMSKAIAKAANFTILFSSSVIPHDWGLATIDGNTTGTIRALKEKQADVGMGSFGPTTERRMYCDYSACHMQESLTWCVPKAQQAPRWRNLLEPFRPTAWLGMIITYLIVSTVIWSVCYCPPKDTSLYIQLKNSFIYIFAAFLGISADKTPNKTSGRIGYFVWLTFGLHFVVAYQAKLIGVLLRPSYERQLSSVEEVLQSGIDYALLPTHRRFYANTDDWKVAQIVRDWQDCHDADACLKRIAYQRDFALCTLKAHAEFESLKYIDADGRMRVYCIPYVTYASELYMTKGYPLKDRIDTMIYRIRNSGLMFKWQRDIERTWRMKYQSMLDVDSGGEQVLTVDHMQGAFAVWIIGNSVALLAFTIEFLYWKIATKRIKIKV